MTRANYWSNSGFADWVRGTNKPSAATGEGWRDWKQSARARHPVRYWIAEEGLDLLQDAIYWPFDKLYKIKYYINNRWVTRTHALTAHPSDIQPGTWCDVGDRFLYCMFNELVDFVEIEQAWHNVAFDSAARKEFNPPWWATGWFRWRTWRSPESGLAYLRWASELRADESWGLNSGDRGYGELTTQAQAAREILELYNWWKHERPARPDPMDASGWTALCEDRRKGLDEYAWFLREDKTKEEKRATRKALDLCHKLEIKYEREDEQMLIRLVKIRKSLWT